MAMPGSRRQPAMVPTLPTGSEIASYGTYLEAQQAVDYLSDQSFAVQQVTIVGTDLRMVERITGRLNYPRVALAGAMTGAWFGLLISLLMYLFTPDGGFPVLAGVLIGAAFGILFAVVSYAMTGGKRDFTSASQVVASRYAILCDPQSAGEASRLLTQGGHAGRVGQRPDQPAAAAPPAGAGHGAPGAPGATGAPAGPENPRARSGHGQYGQMAPVAGSAAEQGTPPAQQPTDAATAASGAPVAGSPGTTGKQGRPRYGLRYEDLEPGAGAPESGDASQDRPDAPR